MSYVTQNLFLNCDTKWLLSHFWNIPIVFIMRNIPIIYLSKSVWQMQIMFGDLMNKKRWRPKKFRTINYTPTLTVREPTDGTKDNIVVKLWHDELEALRLKNINWLGVIKGAEQMWISKSLFAKIYKDAITKITNALINGRSLHIEVGSLGENEFLKPIL